MTVQQIEAALEQVIAEVASGDPALLAANGGKTGAITKDLVSAIVSSGGEGDSTKSVSLTIQTPQDSASSGIAARLIAFLTANSTASRTYVDPKKHRCSYSIL